MRNLILAICVSLWLILSTAYAARASIIDPGLQSALEALDAGQELAVVVSLIDQVDLKQFHAKNKALRREALVQELRGKAVASQAYLLAFLKSRGVTEIKSFWIFNGLAFKAAAEVIQEFADQPGVASLRLDDLLKAPQVTVAAAAAPEWNLTAIHAPELWALGADGAGVAVASMDTGVDGFHPDLASRWRGGSNSWFDPNGEHASPYDKTGHGTQVMGLLVGGGAGGTAIGVAPGAQWIAVKIFDDAGTASFSAIHQGFQWLLDPDGQPATDDAPDVVNNSWGLSSHINACVLEFQPDIQVLRAAEIAVVGSAGNAGPASATSLSPGNYPQSLAVGAVDSTFTVALASSRGPSACDGGVYPDLAAPGVNVRSADLTFGGVFPDSYATASGTSFAAPHVAGAIALLRSAFPGQTVSALELALRQSALDLGLAGADHDSGYGLINVAAAYQRLGNPTACTDTDSDSYFAEAGCGTPQDCNDSNASIYPGAEEIKHDGIDQDCNGFDLTISILSASYTAKRDTLSVEATSTLGSAANLKLEGFGAMKWDRKKSKWSISARPAGGNPGTVTVSGPEGGETALVR